MFVHVKRGGVADYSMPVIAVQRVRAQAKLESAEKWLDGFPKG